MMIVATPVRSQTSHWNCDIHAYQYDMTVYLQLKVGNNVLTDYSDYEIAAFCDEECRGVSVVLTTEQGVTNTSIVRIRVRSNTTSGDRITFKVYQKSVNKETPLDDVITFESLAIEGLPSEPLIFQLSDMLLGDVNGDGEVNNTDATLIVYYKLGRVLPVFHGEVADVNNDGDINNTDATRIVYYKLGRIISLAP